MPAGFFLPDGRGAGWTFQRPSDYGMIPFMELFSLQYLLFVLILAAAGRFLPPLFKDAGKVRQRILLAASLLFYLQAGAGLILFMLSSALSVFAGALFMEKVTKETKEKGKMLSSRDEKKALRQAAQRKKRLVLFAILLYNFGILALFKYVRIPLLPASLTLTLPLGISFYTFMAAGYLIDIYGAKYEAEKSFPSLLLFISWFPQLLQGPIGRYDAMREDLNAPRTPSPEESDRALLLILFGLVKKYAVADMLAPHIASVLDGPVADMPGSMIVFSILMYSAQQYADFSGGIDIVTGISHLLGIGLAPNFRQPYFSTSLGDFWRRWHISLGAWMRDYLFYPFALTKPMQDFSKACSKRFGKHFGRVAPAGIANILVFTVVGLWHGLEAHYILWGLYNGIVIALSDLLSPVFTGLGKRCGLSGDGRGMHIFRILRTFIIVNIGWYFDRITDLSACMTCFKNTVLSFDASVFPMAFRNEFIWAEGGVFQVLGSMALAAAGTAVIFAVSFLRETGRDPVLLLKRKGTGIVFLCVLCMLLMVLFSFVFASGAGGFLYANF